MEISKHVRAKARRCRVAQIGRSAYRVMDPEGGKPHTVTVNPASVRCDCRAASFGLMCGHALAALTEHYKRFGWQHVVLFPYRQWGLAKGLARPRSLRGEQANAAIITLEIGNSREFSKLAYAAWGL